MGGTTYPTGTISPPIMPVYRSGVIYLLVEKKWRPGGQMPRGEETSANRKLNNTTLPPFHRTCMYNLLEWYGQNPRAGGISSA